MYDVFFISYDEPHADYSFAALKQQLPIARRVHGIDGIQKAHRHCAGLSRTRHFFVVDADNRIIVPDVFSYRVPEYDSQYVHLWYARNPINGLEYGWGGLKLFPKSVFTDDVMPLDMTTTFPLKIIPEVKSVTGFNASPFETWRSAFRECVKLTVGNQTDETSSRLNIWQTVANGRYADDALRGAAAGSIYADNNRSDVDALLRINDYKWLFEQFALDK